MTDEERAQRGLRAKEAWEEFLAPKLAAIREEYLNALIKLAANDPTAVQKITNLSVAQNVVATVEQHIREIILDGEAVVRRKTRAQQIEDLPERKKSWAKMMGGY